MEESGSGLSLSEYPDIYLYGLRKTTRDLGQNSRSLCRDLNPGPAEYEAQVLTIRPRRLVRLFLRGFCYKCSIL
jgi:hypothetical protein